ncbi:MAG: 4Fe-4S binding protein [Anaerolineales bacterium]
MKVKSISGQVPYLKIEASCIACQWCKYICPVEGCITFENAVAAVHPGLCIECGRCVFVCPIEVILPVRQPLRKYQGAADG